MMLAYICWQAGCSHSAQDYGAKDLTGVLALFEFSLPYAWGTECLWDWQMLDLICNSCPVLAHSVIVRLTCDMCHASYRPRVPCCFMLHSIGPGLLPFSCSVNSAQMQVTGMFTSSRGAGSPGQWVPAEGTPCMTGCSDLAVHPGPGRGMELQQGNGDSCPTSAHSRKRQPKEEDPICVTALNPRGMDKNGAGCLENGSGPACN